MSSRHRPLRSEHPPVFSPLRPLLRAPRAPVTSPCHHFTPRWGSGTSTRRNQHTTTSKNTARRLHTAAFAARLPQRYAEHRPASAVASHASHAGIHHHRPRPPSSRVAPSSLLRACGGLVGEHARAHEQYVTSAVMPLLQRSSSLSRISLPRIVAALSNHVGGPCVRTARAWLQGQSIPVSLY